MKKIKMFNGSELEVGEKIRFADLWQTEDGDVNHRHKIREEKIKRR